MSLLDGAFMAHAYGWALSNPARRIFYNLTVSTLSVVVALAPGTVELLQVLFAATWGIAALVWWRGRIEERWSVRVSRVPNRAEVG